MANDPYRSYVQQVHNQISQHWTYKGTRLKATVHFFIDRDGKLEGVPIVSEPSGDSTYDALAVRAVYDSEPFPPLPKDYNEKTFEVYFEFSPIK